MSQASIRRPYPQNSDCQNQPEASNQTFSSRRPWSRNTQAVCQQRERKLSFLGEGKAHAASVDLPHHRSSLFHTFPLKSREEHAAAAAAAAAAEILTRRPSLFQIKTRFASHLSYTHTHLSTFSGARPPFASLNRGTSLSFKSPPGRDGRGEEAERHIDPLV